MPEFAADADGRARAGCRALPGTRRCGVASRRALSHTIPTRNRSCRIHRRSAREASGARGVGHAPRTGPLGCRIFRRRTTAGSRHKACEQPLEVVGRGIANTLELRQAECSCRHRRFVRRSDRIGCRRSSPSSIRSTPRRFAVGAASHLPWQRHAHPRRWSITSDCWSRSHVRHRRRLRTRAVRAWGRRRRRTVRRTGHDDAAWRQPYFLVALCLIAPLRSARTLATAVVALAGGQLIASAAATLAGWSPGATTLATLADRRGLDRGCARALRRPES